jgi:hypothetical protein
MWDKSGTWWVELYAFLTFSSYYFNFWTYCLRFSIYLSTVLCCYSSWESFAPLWLPTWLFNFDNNVSQLDLASWTLALLPFTKFSTSFFFWWRPETFWFNSLTFPEIFWLKCWFLSYTSLSAILCEAWAI